MRNAATIRGILWVVIIASLLVLVRALPLAEGVTAVRAWVDGLGVWGPLAFGLIYIVAVVAMLPASLLTLAAGATFGLVVGTITVVIAANIGAALALLICRYLARGRIERLLASRPRLAAVDRAIDEGSWKIVALLRLSPAVPFNVQNYLYGLTSIGFGTCVLTSVVAMLPGTFLYVYLGHVAGSVSTGRTPAEWTLLGVGLLATLVLTIYVARLAREKLRDQTGLDGGELTSGNTAAGTTTEETSGDATATDACDQTVERKPSSAAALLPLAVLTFVLAALACLTLFAPDLIHHLLRPVSPPEPPTAIAT